MAGKKHKAKAIRNDTAPSAAYARLIDGHHILIDPQRDVAYVYAATGMPYVVSLSYAVFALAKPMLKPQEDQ